MLRALRVRRGRHLVARALVCAFLVVLVVPVVHDEAGCPCTAPHSMTCTAHAMAAALNDQPGGADGPSLARSGSVGLNGPVVLDTILPSREIGRSPPAGRHSSAI